MLEAQHPSGRRSTKNCFKGSSSYCLLLLACHKRTFWRNLEVTNLEILDNIFYYFFSRSCLCPLVCLSFVRWKNQNKILRNISVISNFEISSNNMSYDMPATKVSNIFANSSPNKKKTFVRDKVVFHILSSLKEKWELKIGKD